MRGVRRDLRVLVASLVEGVWDRGAAKETVDEYRGACGRLLRFAEGRGEREWSERLAASYAARLDERRAAGEICAGYHRFQRRVLRLLGSLAEGGGADFSPAAGGAPAKYPVGGPEAEAVEEALSAAGLSERARRDLRAPVRHLFWYAAERGVRPLEIDDALVMDFLVREVPRTNAGSAGRTLRAVRVATEWIRASGGRELRDYSLLTLRGASRRIIPAFTEAEIRAMAGAADTGTAKGKRDLAILLVCYCTGLRIGDVLGLRLDEIDWRRGTLTTTQSKTHSPITCVLNGETLNALADYVLDTRPDCGCPEAFVTVHAPHRALAGGWGGSFEALRERAGVEKLPGRSVHSLRRGFETALVSRGVAIETASQMVGHRTIAEDKPYITCDRRRASLVAMGFDDVPIRLGAYAAAGGGGGPR